MKYLFALILAIGLPASANQLVPPSQSLVDRFSVDFEDQQIEIWVKLDEISKTLGELYVLQAKMDFKLKQVHEFLHGTEIDTTQAAVKTP